MANRSDLKMPTTGLNDNQLKITLIAKDGKVFKVRLSSDGDQTSMHLPFAGHRMSVTCWVSKPIPLRVFFRIDIFIHLSNICRPAALMLYQPF
jgi:hypothetical protein